MKPRQPSAAHGGTHSGASAGTGANSGLRARRAGKMRRKPAVFAALTATLDLGPAVALSCRECGRQYPLGPSYACVECFGPLEVAYDFAGVTRASIEAGPRNLWRYKQLLPVPTTVEQTRNTEPGLTPLRRADNLAKVLGMRSLWIKDDTANPTHSFKDRVVAVALAAARELGFGVLACPSTGNLANAVAAAAARAGIRSVVLVPADLEQQKVLATAVYGGTLLAVEGTYDDVNRLASEIAEEHDDWAFVNVNVRPFYAEGSKTLGYEVAEQLGWRLPEQVVIPVASGAQLTKVDKAFSELVALGLVDSRVGASGSRSAHIRSAAANGLQDLAGDGGPAPRVEHGVRVYGAQASGCAPVAAAYKAGHDVVRPVRPDTIAKSLAIGNPADGPYVLDVCRRTTGAVEDVSDTEVVEGISLLAGTEGVFPETAGGVTVAVLQKMLNTGQLDPEAETVIFNTGDGLKTLDAVAATARPDAIIKPTLDAFQSVVDLG
jgi:threonine synthase